MSLRSFAALQLGAALFIAGCQPTPPAISVHCQEMMKSRLTSPGTFAVTELNAFPEINRVFIEFDSQNAFGGLVRSRGWCEYQELEDGLLELTLHNLNGETMSGELASTMGSLIAVSVGLDGFK